jgi:hypothetical protein
MRVYDRSYVEGGVVVRFPLKNQVATIQPKCWICQQLLETAACGLQALTWQGGHSHDL